jgi:hypothetical protein
MRLLEDMVTILANDAIEPSAIDGIRAQKPCNQPGDGNNKYEDAERVMNEAASAGGRGN